MRGLPWGLRKGVCFGDQLTLEAQKHQPFVDLEKSSRSCSFANWEITQNFFTTRNAKQNGMDINEPPECFFFLNKWKGHDEAPSHLKFHEFLAWSHRYQQGEEEETKTSPASNTTKGIPNDLCLLHVLVPTSFKVFLWSCILYTCVCYVSSMWHFCPSIYWKQVLEDVLPTTPSNHLATTSHVHFG